jgi:hypothetical protein
MGKLIFNKIMKIDYEAINCIEYNLLKTLNCKDIIPWRYDDIRKYLRDNKVPILYYRLKKEKYKSKNEYANSLYTTRYLYLSTIYKVKYNDKIYYFYSSIKRTRDCSTCSGADRRKRRIVYSDNLEDLINFIWTPEIQRKVLAKRIKSIL